MIHFSVITISDLVTKAKHAKIMKELNKEVVRKHAEEKLPRRFESVPETYPGTGGLKYRPRKRSYVRSKERKYGHRKPHVKTGGLRDAVLSTWRVTGTQHKGTLHLSGSPEHRLAGWQKEEIERRTRKELREAIRWQKKEYNRLAALPENRIKRRRHRK